jgi:hypothetical protein
LIAHLKVAHGVHDSDLLNDFGENHTFGYKFKQSDPLSKLRPTGPRMQERMRKIEEESTSIRRPH